MRALLLAYEPVVTRTRASATRSLQRRVDARALQALALRNRQTRDDDVRRQIERELAQAAEAAHIDPTMTLEQQRHPTVVEQLIEEVRLARERSTWREAARLGANLIDIRQRRQL